MKPEQINRAIAEHCGWQHKTHGTDTYWWNDNINDGELLSLPNYHDDLNAMHEAEKTLWSMEPIFLTAYCELLMKSRYPSAWGDAWTYIHATSAQRAEAFLRTVGKWKDQ